MARKQFEQLTDAEVLELTDDQISLYIDLACAEQGVAFLPPRPTVPTKPALENDTVVYVIKNMYCSTTEQASAILAAVSLAPLLKSQYDPNFKVLAPCPEDDYEYPKIETLRAVSPELYDRVKKELEQYNADKRVYDREYSEYSKALKEREEIAKSIYTRISEAREELQFRARMTTDFNRYLDLAEGNRTIAMNFFRKAYSSYDLDAQYPDLIASFLNEQ